MVARERQMALPQPQEAGVDQELLEGALTLLEGVDADAGTLITVTVVVVKAAVKDGDEVEASEVQTLE